MAGIETWLHGLFRGKESLGPGRSSPHAGEKPVRPRSFADDNNDFAIAMYGQLRRAPGNVFFSPFSIRTALCMSQAGARGETAEQMRAALSISSSDESAYAAFAEAIRRLKAVGGRAYEMTVANSLWGQEGAPLQPRYLSLIARTFDGDMKALDFRRGAEAARATINQWVEDKTRRRIQDLIPTGSVDALTRLVLVNAVYFKGIWDSKFRRDDTHDEPFHVKARGRVQVPLMHQVEHVRYLRGADYQAVDLDYLVGYVSMLVLLPDRKDGVEALEAALPARLLETRAESMVGREVEVFLPRFNMTWGTENLGVQLNALGISLAFMPSAADFSGINGRAPGREDSLFVSAVFHKAFIEVTEEGTEAAAATANEGEMGAAALPEKPPPIPVFRADHPFLFAIRDRKTGAILFLGRVADPSRGN